MKSVTACLLLLICMHSCSSAVILRCRCVKTINKTNETLIETIKVFEPNSICGKRQIIVKRLDGTTVCLNPQSPFTKYLLKKWFNGNPASSKLNTSTESSPKTTGKTL